MTQPKSAQEMLLRMHSTLTRIEYYWWDYPLAVATALSMLMWVGWFIYTDPAVTHTGAVFGMYELNAMFITTFFVGRIAVRALLSRVCQRHIKDLKQQLQTPEGKCAWHMLRRVDGILIHTAKDASEPGPHL